MESLMEMLKAKGLVTTCDFDPRQYAQLRVDALNDAIGYRDKEDGYNCPICKTKAMLPGWWRTRTALFPIPWQIASVQIPGAPFYGCSGAA